MGSVPLVILAREYWTDASAFSAQRGQHSWLIWRISTDSGPIVAPTMSGVRRATPNYGEPLVLEVIKGAKSAFAFGITIGRTDNNDVVVRDEQVSRFHAYFQATPSGLALVDAESKNGTWVDGARLVPKRPMLLKGRSQISLGSLDLEYFDGPALCAHLGNPVP
jgi:hypothetical protein